MIVLFKKKKKKTFSCFNRSFGPFSMAPTIEITVDDSGEVSQSRRLTPGSTFSFDVFHMHMGEEEIEVDFHRECPLAKGPIKAKIIRQCLRDYVEMYEKRVLHEKPVVGLGTHRASA